MSKQESIVTPSLLPYVGIIPISAMNDFFDDSPYGDYVILKSSHFGSHK